MTRVDRLGAPDADVRLAAIAELTAAGAATPAEVAALAECTAHEKKVVQRRAAEALAAVGAPADALRARLAAPAFRTRWGAAYALSVGAAPPAEVLPILLEAFGEDDGDVRWAAATILVRLVDVGTVVHALRALAATGNVAQRKMALYCLRDLRGGPDASPGAVATVTGALADPAPPVRLAALASLPAVAVDRAAAARAALRLLDDPDAGVRRAAAAALGKLGTGAPEVRRALDAAAAGEDPALARAARRAREALR